MPSPDVREFVDLTLYDLESQSVYLSALDYIRVAMPEFRPVEGSIETVLMQAVAVEVAEIVRSINRLPGGVVQALLKLFEVERLDGVSPYATIRINGSTSTSYTVPVGTRFFYQSQLEATPLVLETNLSVVLTHQKSVSEGSISGGTMTVSTTTPHGFSVGQSITFSGTDSSTFNTSFTIATVPSMNSMTFTGVSGVTAPSDWTVGVATPPSTHPATGFVLATGTTITEEFNGLAAGTELDMLSVVPQVASAFLATAVSGGTNTETDAQYFARASANLARANLSLVTAENYTQWILNNTSFSSVYRAKALDTTDVNRETTAGKVLLVVAPLDASADNTLTGIGDGSITASSPDWGDKDEIRNAAMEISHPNLDVQVSDPFIVSVKIGVSVSPATNRTGVEVANAVYTMLNDYLSPNTWDWSTQVRKNDIIARTANSEDTDGNRVVGYVSSVSISVDGCHIPEGGYATIASAVSSSSVIDPTTVQINTSSPHGLLNTVTNYVGLKVSGDWYAYEVTSIVDSDSFRIAVGTNPTSGFSLWAKVAHLEPSTSTTSPYDLIIADPAPLVVSGDHEVTIV